MNRRRLGAAKRAPGIRLAAFLVAMLAMARGTSSWADAPKFPIRVSENGRHFRDGDGNPFFINGDTAWSLIGQVSREDADLYLKDCAARGINSVIVTLVESHYATNAPANHDGVPPFAEPGKFTTPLEEYFAHADWVIRRAESYGILIVLAPSYLGCCDDGYYQALKEKNSVADARWFGEWVGIRYREFPNLLYVWGNDRNPGDVREKIRAMAEGVKTMDPHRLQTYHAAPENSALDQWDAGESWLGCNISYTYHPVQEKCLEDYRRVPVLPFFLFESRYEGDFMKATAGETRRQAYTAILSGACGHHYGNNPIWHMNGHPESTAGSWKEHLADEGRADLTHVRSLFESRAWHNLIPDVHREVLQEGVGAGDHCVVAARTDDGRTAIAYFPQRSKVSIDLGAIRGSRVLARWYDPREGVWQDPVTYPAKHRRKFCPPSGGDWVLVLDGESQDLDRRDHGASPGKTTRSTK